ncbi:MAG: hypothetical protein LH615_14825 [Ferruginibacter sp.]|nr:hypothetical protein [Ferruginibacter sp.]
MKYKNIFLIWLYADVILIICTLLSINLYDYFKRGVFVSGSISFKNILLIEGVGFIFTIPSLVFMLLFHLIYARSKNGSNSYVKPYILLIFCINFLYLIIFLILIGNKSFYENMFIVPCVFLVTTAAGFTAFYIEHKKIQRLIKYGKKEELIL